MKRFMTIAVACMLLACLGMVLASCDRYEPQSSEGDAVRYYNDKYHANAKVSESHGLGNYNLFGYTYHGMEYVMDDGVSVIYLDDEGFFRDNRQTADIEREAKSFAERTLRAIPGALTPVDVVSVGGEVYYETYKGDGACWAARYDGDIEAFLRAEWPMLSLQGYYSGSTYSDGRFNYVMAYDSAQVDGLEKSYLELGNYFNVSWVYLAVVDPQAFVEGETGLFDDGLLYTIDFKGDSPETMEAVRFKPAFVKLVDGTEISSATHGVTLAEGDVHFTVRSDGFWVFHVTGNAAKQGSLEYYIRNDSGPEITKVEGIDHFAPVLRGYGYTRTSLLVDGGVYYLGDPDDIRPRIEVEEISSDRMTVRYHTHFKDQIKSAKLKVIGMAQKSGSTTYESTEFPSRIVGETPDGWRCVVDIPHGAKRENTLYFQFSYDGDKDVTVQIEHEITLPV